MCGRRVALSRRDACTFGVESQRNCGVGRSDIADCRPHQAGNARGRCEKAPLIPHPLHDVWAQHGLEVGAIERSLNRLEARTRRGKPIAKDDLGEVVQVPDRTVGIARRRDETCAAEDVFEAKTGIQRSEVRHAVQQRENHRLRSNRRCNRIHRGVQVIGLATQQDQVVGFTNILRLDCCRG